MNQTSSWRALFQAEWQKIWAQNKYRIYLGLVALLITLGALLSVIPGNLLKINMAHYPYAILSILCYLVIPLGAFMLASDLLSGEVASSEIRFFMIRPVARHQILTTKILAIIMYLAVLLFGGLLWSSLLCLLGGGFDTFSLFNALMVYIVGCIPALTIAAMAVMIATATKSGTASLGLGILTYLGFMSLGYVLPGIAPLLLTSYLGIGGMVIGSTIPLANLVTGIVVLLAYAMIFFSFSALIFTSRDY